MATHRIIQGDCLEGLRTLPDASVHCCVTSPPYWGLRNYGHDGQIGLESTPEEYVARMVEVFREVRRVLRDDGTLWLNLGDSYAASNGKKSNRPQRAFNGQGWVGERGGYACANRANLDATIDYGECKPKDLVGIPWRVAFALQADGWWLRQDIIWHKPNPMPESVRDRCTKAHEYVFLLTKSQRYYYDAEAVSEAAVYAGVPQSFDTPYKNAGRGSGKKPSGNEKPGSAPVVYNTRNRRSVWTVTTKPYSGAHFAVMPPDLVEPCIKAGCPEGGTVLDPFAGSGTTLAVAAELGRNGIGCELNPEYIELAEQRIAKVKAKTPLFAAG
jgi:DNA modification methylase